MTVYAKGTEVPVARSAAEIESMLMRYGAEDFARGWKSGPPSVAVVGFKVKGRSVPVGAFTRWRAELVRLGYQVDHRILDASLYGAPTRRRRLFLVARCDGQAINWPEPTHGPGLLPVHTAAECIDWSLPCPSIFERKRPLADKTLWRIAQGIRRFVMESPSPFIVKVNHGGLDPRVEPLDEPLTTVTATQRGHALVTPFVAEPGQRHGRGQKEADAPLSTVVAKDRHAVVAPTLIQTGYGEREGQAARVPGLHKPLGTMVSGQKHALVSAFLAKHFGGVVGSPLTEPVHTITARDHNAVAAATLLRFNHDDHGLPVDAPLPTVTAVSQHIAEVRAFLTAYYGEDGTSGQAVLDPLRTITARHRLGLVTVEGSEYQIVDIGMRMLEPHELLRAQFGRFAASYDLSAARTKAGQVRLIGNSVCPEVAEALVRANCTSSPAEAVA